MEQLKEKMPSGMWCHGGLVCTDILDVCVISILKVERIHKLGTVLAITTKLNEEGEMHGGRGGGDM
jgi:hypothetical protein